MTPSKNKMAPKNKTPPKNKYGSKTKEEMRPIWRQKAQERRERLKAEREAQKKAEQDDSSGLSSAESDVESPVASSELAATTPATSVHASSPPPTSTDQKASTTPKEPAAASRKRKVSFSPDAKAEEAGPSTEDTPTKKQRVKREKARAEFAMRYANPEFREKHNTRIRLSNQKKKAMLRPVTSTDTTCEENGDEEMTEATLADMGQNLKKVTEIASALSMWVENFTYEYGAAVYRGHFRKEFEDVQEFVFGIQEQLGECNPDF